MSILELPFLYATMSYITVLYTASMQFTAVWHYCPSPNRTLSCTQLGQLRAAGRSSCQLTSGASWWLLQSAEGLVPHCRLPAMPLTAHDFYSCPTNPLHWNGQRYRGLSALRKTFYISFIWPVHRLFMILHQPTYRPNAGHSIIAFMTCIEGVKTKNSPFSNVQPGRINNIIQPQVFSCRLGQ